MHGLIAIGNRFVKFLLLFLIISNYYVANAQFSENDFKKIFIEIDGEQIYDVNAITQDHQGYIWMATNLGLIRYNGIEGKRYNNKVIDSTSFDFQDINSPNNKLKLEQVVFYLSTQPAKIFNIHYFTFFCHDAVKIESSYRFLDRSCPVLPKRKNVAGF